MCPIAHFQIIFIAAIALGIYFFYFRPRLRRKYEHIARFLNAELRYPFLYFAVEGFYKGRRVKIDSYVKNNVLRFHIEPRIVPKEPPVFSLFYPAPTRNTVLAGRRIYYRFSLGMKMKLIYTNYDFPDAGLSEIFEELTRAAQIVETNAPYYKEKVFALS